MRHNYPAAVDLFWKPLIQIFSFLLVMVACLDVMQEVGASWQASGQNFLVGLHSSSLMHITVRALWYVRL